MEMCTKRGEANAIARRLTCSSLSLSTPSTEKGVAAALDSPLMQLVVEASHVADSRLGGITPGVSCWLQMKAAFILTACPASVQLLGSAKRRGRAADKAR